MKISSSLLIGTFFCLSWQVSAVAALISRDDPVFGVGSITRDTVTNLDWLDVPLSQGRTFIDVAGEFGSGGDFEGFRHATEAEFRTLVVNAGIPDINVTVTGDLTPFTNLINLLGATSSQEGNPETFGFLNDPNPGSPGLRVNGDLDFFFSNGVPAYVASTKASRSESVQFNSVGHWLVVPEPLTILGSGLALGFGAYFKKEYSRKQKQAKTKT